MRSCPMIPGLLGTLTGFAMLLQASVGKGDSLVRLGVAGIHRPASSKAQTAGGRLRSGFEACLSHWRITHVTGACLPAHAQ
jgi:hypothetical protein